MKKIAIIGCGISGLYFANLLQRKKICDYTIYEKKSELNLNDGYGIQLSVNSIKLLNEIGFNNIVAKEISFPTKVNFFDAKNCKKICEIDISKFNSENKRYTTLKRSFLIKFLLNNIPNEKIKNNLEITGIDPKLKSLLTWISSWLVVWFEYEKPDENTKFPLYFSSIGTYLVKPILGNMYWNLSESTFDKSSKTCAEILKL